MSRAPAHTGHTQGRDFTLFGSWFDNHTDSQPNPFELSWAEFTEVLTSRFAPRPSKFEGDCWGFNLARFFARDGIVRRQNAYVDILSGVVLDFDKNYNLEKIFDRLEGVTHFAYTTFSHTADTPKWRVILPTLHPIPAAKYKAVRSWVVTYLNEGLPPSTSYGADEQAKAVSNFFFGPGCPAEHLDAAEWRLSDDTCTPFDPPPPEEYKRGIPTVRVLGNKIDWPFITARMKTYAKDETIRRAFKSVLKGKSFAEQGNRDTTLVRMCGAIAGWAPSCEPEELAQVFAQSLEAMAAENPEDPPPDIANAADKIARAQASLSASSRQGAEQAVEDAQEIRRENPVDEDIVVAWAEGAGLPDTDALRRRLLLRKSNSLWMWRYDLGTWSSAMTEAETQAAARIDLAFIPGVEVHVRKVDGGIRLKTLPELFHEYGERADNVRYDLSLTRGRYETATRTLLYPGAPRRDLEPEFDAQVDEWMRALGGAKAEKLLDWIAGLTDHARPNSVLFIQGDPGVGKGLLVRGLAHVWRADNATEMKIASSNFNDDLLRCPLINIDEGKWDNRVDVTTLLRNLVTQGSRMVNPKNLALVELTGHLRFIVTANNFNIFASDRHALTPADRDAIAERFFEVSPDPKASELLLQVAPLDRGAMATDGRIAKHALWLAANRPRTSDGRFVVSGDKSSRFATKIITEDHSYGSWTVEWLARYLSNPVAVEASESALVWRGTDDGVGRVIVSPEAVINTFEKILRNKRPPQALEISNALRSLSSGTLVPFPNGKGGKGFDILVEEVAFWADEKGVGNKDAIRKNAKKIHVEPLKAVK